MATRAEDRDLGVVVVVFACTYSGSGLVAVDDAARGVARRVASSSRVVEPHESVTGGVRGGVLLGFGVLYSGGHIARDRRVVEEEEQEKKRAPRASLVRRVGVHDEHACKSVFRSQESVFVQYQYPLCALWRQAKHSTAVTVFEAQSIKIFFFDLQKSLAKSLNHQVQP